MPASDAHKLTELLLSIDGETHFSWELLGRPPVAPEELVPVYAALFVAAMGLDMTDVAIMIPGVRLADIRRASRLLEEDRALRRANEVVVAFMLAQPLAKAWGEGFEASSDLISLDVNRNLWCRAWTRSVGGTPSERTPTFSISGVSSMTSRCSWQPGKPGQPSKALCVSRSRAWNAWRSILMATRTLV